MVLIHGFDALGLDLPPFAFPCPNFAKKFAKSRIFGEVFRPKSCLGRTGSHRYYRRAATGTTARPTSALRVKQTTAVLPPGPHRYYRQACFRFSQLTSLSFWQIFRCLFEFWLCVTRRQASFRNIIYDNIIDADTCELKH